MKLAICAVLVTLSVCVYAEKCTTNNDCGSTNCSSGYHVVCEHPTSGVVANGGLCTCAKDDYSCTTRNDCLGADVALRCIDDAHRHCYDGKCICTRW